MGNVIEEAIAKRRALEAEAEGEYTPAPAGRRLSPMLNERQANPLLVGALALIGIAAAIYVFTLPATPGTPAAVEWPTAAPAQSSPALIPPSEPAVPTAPALAPAPIEAQPIGTDGGYIEPVAPPQLAPAGVGQDASEVAATEAPISDLIPIEPPGWHAPLAPGQAPPTPSNFVEVRP
jgi:hypothetical protein